jgi:hypothetical protein
MNKKHAIAAFSIIETVVSLVITAIVMGLIFLIFSILSERMMDFKLQNETIADLNRLTYLLNKDIFESEEMSSDAEALHFYSSKTGKIDYHIHEKYTLRHQHDFIDTFKLIIKHFKSDTLQHQNQKVVFNRIWFETEINGKLNDLSFFRRIHSDELIKQYASNEH